MKIIIISFFVLFTNAIFSQTININGSYNYYFLNNSKYNSRNINFNYLSDYKIKSNHNFDLNISICKPNLNYLLGFSYQYHYGETKLIHDSTYFENSYRLYDLIRSRKMNMIGFNFGIDKELIKKLHTGIKGVLGWSFIRKLSNYTPDGSYLPDDDILSKGPFFSFSFITKYNLFHTKKFESSLVFSVNERFIEFKSNFTLGLGIEFTFIDIKRKLELQ